MHLSLTVRETESNVFGKKHRTLDLGPSEVSDFYEMVSPFKWWVLILYYHRAQRSPRKSGLSFIRDMVWSPSATETLERTRMAIEGSVP